MHLTQANIEYFRSLYNVELSLKPLTILIGPNASGKSNLFKALRFLYDAVAGDRLDWQAYHGHIDVLRWFGGDEYGNRPNVLDFALNFGREKTESNSVRYAATFRCGDYLEIGHERLALRLNTSDDGLTTYFERWGKGITYFRDQFGVASDTPISGVARSSQALTLREEGPSLSLPQAQAAYSHIAG